jgi:hypothetical protein
MGVGYLGTFPRAIGGYRYLYIAIDKFTKWPEATPVVNITKTSAITFLKSIVCQFRVPNRIITDKWDPVQEPALSRILRGHRHAALLRFCGK